MHTVGMILLRFSAENHGCLRDRVELDMVSSDLKVQRPSGGDWASVVHPVAGIFGANASGKSTVLDAIGYAQAAVRLSASAWLERKRFPRVPFRLDDTHPSAASTYVFDFVLDGVRHEYGFSVSPEGVETEWLIDYPTGRRRLLFDRATKREEPFEFGRALKRPGTVAAAVSPRELLLSRAAVLKHHQLAPVAAAITDGIDVALFGEPYQQHRIQGIIDTLVEGRTSFDDIVTLLSVADIGIERVAIREEEVPPAYRRLIAALNAAADPGSGDAELGDGDLLTSSEREEVLHRLEFFHQGQGESRQGFSLSDESTGTISWLSLALPAIEALRHGTVLVVDEIDASLHPQLSSVLLGMFLDRELNVRGAQLIFTSHDTYLLSPQAPSPLEAEQVWFTQKAADGSVELFSLAEFSARRTDNVARRYLAGRFGAVPRTAPSLLRGLLTDARGAGV